MKQARKLLRTARSRSIAPDGTSVPRRGRARPHLHARPPKRQRAAWPVMRAREEDRRGEHGLLLGYVRRAGSLYCLMLHLKRTTRLSVRTSQLAATRNWPNPSQSSQLAACQHGSHVVVACRTCRTTLRAGGSATARSSTGSAGAPVSVDTPLCRHAAHRVSQLCRMHGARAPASCVGHRAVASATLLLPN